MKINWRCWLVLAEQAIGCSATVCAGWEAGRGLREKGALRLARPPKSRPCTACLNALDASSLQAPTR
jgi:hypothetical protein